MFTKLQGLNDRSKAPLHIRLKKLIINFWTLFLIAAATIAAVLLVKCYQSGKADFLTTLIGFYGSVLGGILSFLAAKLMLDFEQRDRTALEKKLESRVYQSLLKNLHYLSGELRERYVDIRLEHPGMDIKATLTHSYDEMSREMISFLNAKDTEIRHSWFVLYDHISYVLTKFHMADEKRGFTILNERLGELYAMIRDLHSTTADIQGKRSK